MADTSIWKPVEESTSAWKPVSEQPKPKPIGEQSATLGGTASVMADQAMRAGGAFLQNINPMPLVRAVAHPVDTARGMFQQTSDAIGRSKTALREGRYGDAAQAGVGAIPLVGPPAEQIVGDVRKGDIASAVGHGAGLYAAAAAAEVPGAAGKVLSKGSGPLAAFAERVRPYDVPKGVTRGQMGDWLLDNTQGYSPFKVGASGKQSLGALADETKNAADAATTRTLAPGNSVVDFGPSRTIGDQALARVQQHTSPLTKQIKPLSEFFEKPGPSFGGNVTTSSGSPQIARFQTPAQALETRRLFSEAHADNPLWRDQNPGLADTTAQRQYGALSGELHKSVPETIAPDQQYHVGAGGVKAADRTAKNAGLLQNVLARAAAHTGALTGAVYGYEHGGIPGGLSGLIIPELVGNPSAQMAAARGLRGAGRFLQSPTLGRGAAAGPFVRTRQDYE